MTVINVVGYLIILYREAQVACKLMSMAVCVINYSGEKNITSLIGKCFTLMPNLRTVGPARRPTFSLYRLYDSEYNRAQ